MFDLPPKRLARNSEKTPRYVREAKRARFGAWRSKQSIFQLLVRRTSLIVTICWSGWIQNISKHPFFLIYSTKTQKWFYNVLLYIRFLFFMLFCIFNTFQLLDVLDLLFVQIPRHKWSEMQNVKNCRCPDRKWMKMANVGPLWLLTLGQLLGDGFTCCPFLGYPPQSQEWPSLTCAWFYGQDMAIYFSTCLFSELYLCYVRVYYQTIPNLFFVLFLYNTWQKNMVLLNNWLETERLELEISCWPCCTGRRADRARFFVFHLSIS